MSQPSDHYGKRRVRWVDEKGKRQSRTLSDDKAARHVLAKAKVEVEERRRGLRPPELEHRTFRDASTYWRENRAPQKRSYKDDLSMLKQLDEHFARLSLHDPGAWVVAVDRYKATKAKLNVKTIANHLTLLGSILKLAHELGWMDRMPVIKKPRVRLHSTDYSYLRTDEEVSRFLQAALEEGEVVFMLYAMAVYTGLRAGELAGLHWSDISFEQRLITVHRSFDGPTKAEDVRHVPLLDVLLPHLRQWRLKHPGKLVFTNQEGRMLGESARVFQEVLHRSLKRANFPTIQRSGKTRNYIHFHDLRHTFASHWMMKGGDIFKLQKILGHKSMAMTQRYAHLQPAMFREDYGRFATPQLQLATVQTMQSAPAEPQTNTG